MGITRAVAGGLLLLALILGVQAEKCTNCGLDKGDGRCHCAGDKAVRAQTLAKPEVFASPEAIKNALKLKSACSSTSPPAPAPILSHSVPPVLMSAYSYSPSTYSFYGFAPTPGPVSYGHPPPSPTPSPPIRSKSFVETTCRNHTGSRLKHFRDSEDLKNLLRLPPGTSIAPKFEPIGDLCHVCTGYKDGTSVVGVIPARPGNLPCKCAESEAQAETESPSASSHSAATALYGASAASNLIDFYSQAQYAPAYQTPAAYSSSAAAATPTPVAAATTAPAQYAAAYQQPSSPAIYAAASHPPADYASKDQPAVAAYAQAAPSSSSSSSSPSSSLAKRFYEESKPQTDCKYNGEQKAHYDSAGLLANAIYAAESYKTSESQAQGNCKSNQVAAANPSHEAAHLESSPVAYVTAAVPSATASDEQSDARSDKDEKEVEMYVEIVLQEEETPKYTADPVSISLAYKKLAESQGKKYIPEDTLAYGHFTEPADGRICKQVSSFDEEKLHTVDKPVVELKDCECADGECENLQVSYSDIGYGPVAPSKNRFVPKTDEPNSSNSPYGPSIIVVPPPEDKEESLPCGPLGPTVPGYVSGGVVVSKDSNAKPTCGRCGKTPIVQEGSRKAILVDEDEECDGDRGRIIERIKSCACEPK